MDRVLYNIKKNSTEIKQDADNRSSKAKKLIDAFCNFRINGCKQTELHLKSCYNTWSDK